MVNLITRTGKGSPLTNSELDADFNAIAAAIDALTAALSGKASQDALTALQNTVAQLGSGTSGGSSGSSSVQSGSVGASPVVIDLAASGLLGPFFLNIQPDAGCTIRVETSTNGGSSYAIYDDIQAARTALYDRSPGASSWANRLRLTRMAGTATDSRYSLGSVVAVTIPTAAPADVTAPTLYSMAITATYPDCITLTYSEPINSGVPAGSAYTLGGTIVSGAKTYVSTTVESNVVRVKYSSNFTGSDKATFAYAPPSSNQIRDLAGNAASAISAIAVANGLVPPAIPITTYRNQFVQVTPNANGFVGVAKDWGPAMVPATSYGVAVNDHSWSLNGDGWAEMQINSIDGSWQMMYMHVSAYGNDSGSLWGNCNFAVRLDSGAVTPRTHGDFVESARYTFPNAAPLNKVRINRLINDGTVTMETSLDGGATWTVRYTYPDKEQSTDLYPMWVIDVGSQLWRPAAYGLNDYGY